MQEPFENQKTIPKQASPEFGRGTYWKTLGDFLFNGKIELVTSFLPILFFATIAYFVFNSHFDLPGFALWITLTTPFSVSLALPFCAAGVVATHFRKKTLFKGLNDANNIEFDLRFKRGDSFYYIAVLASYQLLKIYFYTSFFVIIAFVVDPDETRRFLLLSLKLLFPIDLSFLSNEILRIIYCSLGAFGFFYYASPNLTRSIAFHSLGIVKVDAQNGNRNLLGLKLPELTPSEILLTLILYFISSYQIYSIFVSNPELLADFMRTFSVFLLILSAYIFLFFLFSKGKIARLKEIAVEEMEKNPRR